MELIKFLILDEWFHATLDINPITIQSKTQSTIQPSIVYTDTCCDENNCESLDNHDNPTPDFEDGVFLKLKHPKKMNQWLQ